MSSYRRLLNKFSRNHIDDFALLHQHLAAGDSKETRQLTHSLKVAAATLSAVAVQKSAANLEAAINEGQPATLISPLIEQTATIFAKLCRDLPSMPDEASNLSLTTGQSASPTHSAPFTGNR